MSNNLRTAVHTLQVVRDKKTVEIAPGTVDDFGDDTEAFEAAGAVREPTDAELALHSQLAKASSSEAETKAAGTRGRPSNADKAAAETAAKEAEEKATAEAAAKEAEEKAAAEAAAKEAEEKAAAEAALG